MESEVSIAAGSFFFAAARVGLRAMERPYAVSTMNKRRTIAEIDLKISLKSQPLAITVAWFALFEEGPSCLLGIFGQG
jgi:hypothetical protein